MSRLSAHSGPDERTGLRGLDCAEHLYRGKKKKPNQIPFISVPFQIITRARSSSFRAVESTHTPEPPTVADYLNQTHNIRGNAFHIRSFQIIAAAHNYSSWAFASTHTPSTPTVFPEARHYSSAIGHRSSLLIATKVFTPLIVFPKAIAPVLPLFTTIHI